MLRYVGNQIADFLEEIDYYGRKALTYATGKAGIAAGQTGVELATASLPGALNLTAFAAPKTVAFAVAAPAAVGLSAYMVYRDHNHRIDNLTRRYREEIGSWLGMEPEKVGRDDLYRAAENNPTLKEAITQSEQECRIGIALSVPATGGAIALLNTPFWEAHGAHDDGTLHHYIKESVEGSMREMLVPGYTPAEEGAHQVGMQFTLQEAMSSTSLAAGAGMLASYAVGLLALGAAGFAMYVTIKTPLHWLADQLMGLERVTVDDRIREIERSLELGDPANRPMISQERVFLAYLEAHPSLEREIKEAHHGQRFDRLSVPEKQTVLLEMDKRFGLSKLTQDINLGIKSPRVLAGAVVGQKFGDIPARAGKSHGEESGFSLAWKQCAESLRGLLGTSRKEGVEKEAHEELSACMPVLNVPGAGGNGGDSAPATSAPEEKSPKLWVRSLPGYAEAEGRSADGDTRFAARAGIRKGEGGEMRFAEAARQTLKKIPGGSYAEFASSSTSVVER